MHAGGQWLWLLFVYSCLKNATSAVVLSRFSSVFPETAEREDDEGAAWQGAHRRVGASCASQPLESMLTACAPLPREIPVRVSFERS